MPLVLKALRLGKVRETGLSGFRPSCLTGRVRVKRYFNVCWTVILSTALLSVWRPGHLTATLNSVNADASPTSDQAGDPLHAAFEMGSLMHTAVMNNMLSVTGGYSKSPGTGGIPQQLVYRLVDADKYEGENAFNPSLNVLAFYVKENATEPVRSLTESSDRHVGRNLPDASARFVKAAGLDLEEFRLASLQSILPDVSFSDSGRRKQDSLQPIVLVNGGQISIYGSVEQPAQCFARFVHNHRTLYGRLGNYPTKLQLIGVTDEAWVDKDVDAETFFQHAPLCGLCVDIAYGFAMRPTATFSACPAGPENVEGFQR
eukprot:TRINITY_DN65006_c0_g1_i1.p1 TRINITY_DN65006_c0_g1~~TRINITY_DN65006_c0_g1_i1.p1  ORF type:complete len:316 (-),score=31.81 TRINITY_DN65006_c0_g1_i1:160-1107(-)